MTEKIEFPTVHMNGTGYNSLMREVTEAITALKNAKEKVSAMTVHSRDYYVKSNYDESWQAAQNEVRDRILAINSVIDELEEYRLKIAEQKS